MAFWHFMAIGCVLALAIAVWASSIRIRIRYSRSGHFDQLVVIARALFGLVRIQTAIPSIMVKGFDIVYRQREKEEAGLIRRKKRTTKRIGMRGASRFMKRYRTLLGNVFHFKKRVRKLLRKVECTRWRLDIEIGLGDAALTGTAAGLAWSVLGCAAALTGHFVALKTHPHGSVKPNYSGEELSIVWEADFRLRFGDAFVELAKFGTGALRIAKTVRSWRAAPGS